MYNLFLELFLETWKIFLDASPYVLAGFLVAGVLYVFIDPATVSRHLGRGRVRPVVLAALFGIPIPLCSCGVVPTAFGLRKQGANDGATVSFLISTPETGVDSIAITYALMDPLMTLARPVSAFVTAVTAGVLQNVFGKKPAFIPLAQQDLTCKVDTSCCDGCGADEHKNRHSLFGKIRAGVVYAFGDLLDDMATWMVFGFILAGVISVAIPEEFIARYMGGGLVPMLVMLIAGIPMYICATASTPIAAALVLKGLSPGAALVFLLAGPATNIASLTVVGGTLGKRALAIYLSSIAVCSIVLGSILDFIYLNMGLKPSVITAGASELLPGWLEWGTAIMLIVLLTKGVIKQFRTKKKYVGDDCGCSGSDHTH